MSTNPNRRSTRTAYRTRTTDTPTVEDRESTTPAAAPSMFAPTDETMPEMFETEAEYTDR